jgi:glycosyltransferase involved in cell wall biosynthesis
MSDAPRERVNIAILTTAPTPYRLALHRRIDAELPEVRLFSLYSHDMGDQPWKMESGEADRSVSFGAGQRADRPSKLSEFPRDWSKGGKMIAWLRANDIRAMVIGGYSDLARLRLMRWCRRNGVPAFLNADSNVHIDAAAKRGGARALVKRGLLKWVIRQCAGVMPCGNFGAEYFLKYGSRRESVYYFPYEPDYSLIDGITAQEVENVLARFGLRSERKRLVFCARMTDFKKPDLAIDSFARIAAQRVDWDLVMIGNGPMLESVKARVPATLKDRVHFPGFIAEQRVISAIYRGSHVFVHPSVYEPWGVVINEAVCAEMALACARTVGAAGELLRDRVNGRAFEPDDLASMTESLLDVTNPANLENYRRASRAVLDDWRRRGDPVDGLRTALKASRVIR